MQNTKVSPAKFIVSLVQSLFYAIIMVLMVRWPCLAQELDPDGIYLEDCDFLQIRESDAVGEKFVNDIELLPNREYSVLLYVHNISNAELGTAGAVKGIHYTLSAPTTVEGQAELSALVTTENTIPAIVGSTVKLRSDRELSLIFTDGEGESYPIQCRDGDMELRTFLSAVKLSLDGQTTISGEIGDLPAGDYTESMAVIIFTFRTEAAIGFRSVGLTVLGWLLFGFMFLLFIILLYKVGKFIQARR